MKPKLLLCLALVLSGGLANAADTNSLRVVIIPSKTEVRVREPFSVAFRVENPTKTNQTVRVMSCSWYDEWQSSNTNINLVLWPCTANCRVDVEIHPGGAYTNESSMLIYNVIPDKQLSFRMGFTPIDSNQTFWSGDVKLNIAVPAKLDSTSPASKYFETYLAGCNTNEVRSLWFLDDKPNVGMKMTINLDEKTAETMTDVYSWAQEGGGVQKLSDTQVQTLKEIINKLPASDQKPEFNKSVFVSVRTGGKVNVFQYDRRHIPTAIQRLYDLAGGYFYGGKD